MAFGHSVGLCEAWRWGVDIARVKRATEPLVPE